MKFLRHCFAALLCTIMVVACSGSDGGSSSPPPLSITANIDANNAASVAAGVTDIVFASRSFSDVLDGGGLGDLIGTTSSGQSKRGGSLSYFASVPVPILDRPCVFVGDVTLSSEVLDPTTLSAGDRFIIEFFDCDDGTGKVLTGIYEIVINSFSGDLELGQFSLDATVTLTGFEVLDERGLTSLNGVVTVQLDTTLPPITNTSISGDSVSISTNTQSATLSAFQTDVTLNAGVAPEAYMLAATGALTSIVFEGDVNYSTPVTFQGSEGEYPFAGELLIMGTGGASVRLIALDNVNVRLEINLGDGSGTVTQETTWAELAANVP